jgi:hypothetical protein
MSIPLDRLYNFLDSQNDYNVIIYRFTPHGSKKLEDLKVLTEYPSWIRRMTIPHMICHDQEPLDFDYYKHSDFEQFIINGDQKFVKSVQDFLRNANLNFRIIDAKMAFNCYDYVLLCHSEKNSNNLRLYKDAGFVGVYWWSHAVIARDWFRYAEHDKALTPNFDSIVTDFLIYNRAWSGTREYRLTLAEMIVENNLQHNCNIKFSPVDTGIHYSAHQFKNLNLAITADNLENVYPVNTADATSSADYDNADYSLTGIEVVLETLFDDTRHHLTEKALRPIACGRPFILAATPNSLAYLRSYGFETFSGLINEAYDSIADPKQRLQAIVTEMKRISQLPAVEKKELWQKLYAIADRNKKKFFSNEWHESIVQEYRDNFNAAMLTMNNNRSGRIWREIQRISQTDPELQYYTTRDTAARTVKEMAIVDYWLDNNYTFPKDS